MQRRQTRQLAFARRLATYLLMIVTVIVLVVILSLTVIGYRFNFSTQTVEQTGLVQYDSFPRGALVKVDGNTFETTQTKGAVLPGQRQFSMSMKGYENWQKTLDIRSGTVTWLNYARLVPTDRQVTTVETLTDLSSTMASPDRRFLAGISSSADGAPELTMIDFRDSRQPKLTVTPLDTTVLSGFLGVDAEVSSRTINIAEWSQSSRYLLLKHEYAVADNATQTEWLWLDRESPGKLVNVTKLLGLPISSMHIVDNKTAYILQDTGDIRRVSVEDGAISRPIISQASWFEVYQNDTIAYLGLKDESRVAGVWKRDWQQPTVLALVPQVSDQQLHISVSEYFNKDTAVISNGSSISVYRGTLPSSAESKEMFIQSQRKFTLNRPVTSLQVNDSGRFVIAEDESGVVSYDLERSSVSQEIEKYYPQTIGWLDGYHLKQVDDKGRLLMQEFDGVNSYPLLPVSVGFDSLLTQDGKYVYGLAQAENGSVELRRLSMQVSNR